jgi:hypothetical protein
MKSIFEELSSLNSIAINILERQKHINDDGSITRVKTFIP